MNLKGWSAPVLLAAISMLSTSAAVATPVVGQVDDFEDGTTQGWFVNAVGMGPPPAAALPTNIADGRAGRDR